MVGPRAYLISNLIVTVPESHNRCSIRARTKEPNKLVLEKARSTQESDNIGRTTRRCMEQGRGNDRCVRADRTFHRFRRNPLALPRAAPLA
jgi:hypothetical protein